MNNWPNTSSLRGAERRGNPVYISLILLCALAVGSTLISGCTNNETPQSDEVAERNVQDIPTNETPGNETTPNESPAREAPAVHNNPGTHRTEEERASSKVDIDLTKLSSTVLSAELMNIIVNSEDYLGKTIRVSGTYYNLFFEQTGSYYHYVITKAGDECCQEGIEFRLSGDPVFPDDFPRMRTIIEVEGVFSTYEELGREYYYLAVDNIFLLR